MFKKWMLVACLVLPLSWCQSAEALDHERLRLGLEVFAGVGEMQMERNSGAFPRRYGVDPLTPAVSVAGIFGLGLVGGFHLEDAQYFFVGGEILGMGLFSPAEGSDVMYLIAPRVAMTFPFPSDFNLDLALSLGLAVGDLYGTINLDDPNDVSSVAAGYGGRVSVGVTYRGFDRIYISGHAEYMKIDTFYFGDGDARMSLDAGMISLGIGLRLGHFVAGK